jgi:hypothetical protein
MEASNKATVPALDIREASESIALASLHAA